MIPDLPDRLKQMGRLVNRKHPTVNWGGCGVYASAVSQQLKQLGIRPRILVAGQNTVFYTDNIRKVVANTRTPTLSTLNADGIWVGHLFVEFVWRNRRWIHDSERTVEQKNEGRVGNWVFHKGYLTPAEVMSMARSTNGWNEQFNRKEIPALEKRVERFFKDKIFAKSVDSTCG